MQYKDFYTYLFESNVETGTSAEESKIELTERGYNYISQQIDKLNKKAARWKVPPMNLKVIKEEFRKEKIAVNMRTKQPTNPDVDPSWELVEVVNKYYIVEVEGKAPVVEGYQFIAKVEYTEAGNIINFAPDVSEKSVPDSYRTAAQYCDVCKEKRLRYDTFVLKLMKDDLERFPDKKTGDYIMAGSGCLKRFLPGVSVKALIEYAEFLKNFKKLCNEAGEMKDSYGGGGSGRTSNYESTESLLSWLCGAYLITGKYVSRTKAEQAGISSTTDTARTAMSYTPRKEYGDALYYRMKDDDEFSKKSKQMATEVIAWAKQQDFNSMAVAKPEFSSLYKNLAIVSKLEYIKYSNFNYLGAMFGMYLHDTKKTDPNAAAKPVEPTDYLGTIGQKATLTVEVKRVKEFQNNYGYRGGTSYIYTMTGEEKATGKKGPITYFSSNMILDEDDKAEIIATIKNHQINKFTNKPETVITRAKVVKNLTEPTTQAATPTN
jgi:hypothetical protein